MDLINIWAYGTIATGALFAWRRPMEDTSNSFILSAIWPVTISVVVVALLLDLIGWDFNLEANKKMFEFRTPSDGWKGFAITVFHAEVQIWKKRSK